MTRQQYPDDDKGRGHGTPPPDAARVVALPRPYDFEATVRFTGLGLYDPACRRGRDSLWQAARTPRGPVTLRLTTRGEEVRASAWGPGAAWALDRAEAILGLEDEPGAFRPPPGPLATLARRGRGMRLVRTPWVFDVLCQVVLQQRVSFRDAARSYTASDPGTRRGGTRASRTAPSPRATRLAAACRRRTSGGPGSTANGRDACVPLRGRRRRSTRPSTGRPRRRERSSAPSPGAAPGQWGWWPGFALGDPDAVPVGDLHLPSTVANALAGEPRADDTRMLELLEPYRGHRFRLIRLLLAADRIRLGRGAAIVTPQARRRAMGQAISPRKPRGMVSSPG